ncbi:MAG: hypothetical protein JEZ07_15025 [Phycisphaerae bacterium]|nr:hypothetical protein [Phycisphaerae bacterium]
MRKWTITIHDFPALQNKYYTCKVISLKNKGKVAFGVTFELLSRNQTGRHISIDLPLPVRPQGITIRFFQACGFNLEVGQKFALEDTIGKKLQCFFADTDKVDSETISFKPIINKENNHANQPDTK